MNTKREDYDYERWQGFANALLLAITVLFAGILIALPQQVETNSIRTVIIGTDNITSIFTEIIKISFLLSILSSGVGMVLTVLWFTREDKNRIGTKPRQLYLASAAFAMQVVTTATLLIMYFFLRIP